MSGLTPEFVTKQLDHGPSPIVSRIADMPYERDRDGSFAAYAVVVANQTAQVTECFARHHPTIATDNWNNLLVVMDNEGHRTMTLRFSP